MTQVNIAFGNRKGGVGGSFLFPPSIVAAHPLQQGKFYVILLFMCYILVQNTIVSTDKQISFSQLFN